MTFRDNYSFSHCEGDRVALMNGKISAIGHDICITGNSVMKINGMVRREG